MAVWHARNRMCSQHERKGNSLFLEAVLCNTYNVWFFFLIYNTTSRGITLLFHFFKKKSMKERKKEQEQLQLPAIRWKTHSKQRHQAGSSYKFLVQYKGTQRKGQSYQHWLLFTTCYSVRDENGWERAGKPLNHFRFRFLLRETRLGAEQQVRKQDITVTEMGGNRKIYLNALLFNHHSLCMNKTLDTPLHNLFFFKI